MFLNIRKIPAFLLFLSLLMVCATAVSAQNEFSAQSASAELHLPTSPTESEFKVRAVSENLRADDAPRSPAVFQNSAASEKSIFKKYNDSEAVEDDNQQSSAGYETAGNDFAYHFRSTERIKREFDWHNSSTITAGEKFLRSPAAAARSLSASRNAAPDDDAAANVKEKGFRWRAAIGQSLLFLAVQHGYAFTQPKTREAIKGKFWKDYVESVESLHGWDDGGRFFTNYIAHPMQGSMTGFIYVQNDPKAIKQQFGTSGGYWKSRMKAMLWTAAWSTQFEIGPISQASIGNVGLKGKQTWEDIVNTPTLGTAMLIGEDAIDRFVMQRIERSTDNFYVRIFSRMLLSPTRVFANLLRFKPPWHRDRPVAR